MNRSLSIALVLSVGACLSSFIATGSASVGDAKRAKSAIERWARAAGGWKQLEKADGASLRGKRRENGMESGFEGWVSRHGVKHVTGQPPDRSESVCDGRKAWVKDWNGKVLELQGRDATDQITANWLETVACGGLSQDAIRQAHPVGAAADSSGAFEILQFEPAGGVPFSLYLDQRTGLPVKAVRKPYDDESIFRFDDWREVQGVKVPFLMHEFTSADSEVTSPPRRVRAGHVRGRVRIGRRQCDGLRFHPGREPSSGRR